jgi:glutamyl-tRNA synthetase
MAGDVLDYSEFYVADEQLEYDSAAVEKRIENAAGARELLIAYAAELPTVEPFDAATLELHLKDFVERRGVKIGDIVHAVRVAVTGKAVGFGLFDALAILGRERCVRRIARALVLSP